MDTKPPQQSSAAESKEASQLDLLSRIEAERDHGSIGQVLAATTSPSANIRSVAADVLSVLGETAEEKERVGNALIAMLNDEVDFVRSPVVEALGLHRYKPACLPLADLLQDDPDLLVRICAAESLGYIGDPAAIPALIAALADPVSVVRRYAMASLGLVGTAEEIPICLQQAQKEKEEDPGVVFESLLACYRLGHRESLSQIEACLEAWREDPAFWEEGEPCPLSNMLDFLFEESPPLHLEKDRVQLDRITATVARIEYKDSRYMMMRFAKKQGTREPSRLISEQEYRFTRLLESEIKGMRKWGFSEEWVSQAVDLIHIAKGEANEGALQRALKATSSPVEEIRFRAAYALARLGSTLDEKEHIGAVLLGLLSDHNDEVRRAAAESLGLQRYKRACLPLMDVLHKDPYDLVRVCAAESLGYIGDPAAIPALIAALADPVSVVRQYAVASLGLVGSAKEIPICLQQAQNEKEEDPVAATESLLASYRMGHRESLSLLEAWLEDPGFLKEEAGRPLSNALHFLLDKNPPSYLEEDRVQLDRIMAKVNKADEEYHRKILGPRAPKNTSS